MMVDWQENYLNRVTCGECLELMRELPDKCVDAVVTDPPYGEMIDRKSNTYGDSPQTSRVAGGKAWDDNIPTAEYFAELFRISRNQIIFGGNYYLEYLHSTRCYIVWDKRGNLPQVPFCDTEWAWTSFDKMSKKYTVINHGFIRDSKDERSGHPTQKPTEVMVQIINDFTSPTDIILDPFLGSGTTAVAAIRTGRQFIGFEIDPHYCEIAERRIRDERAQTKIEFEPTTKYDQTGIFD